VGLDASTILLWLWVSWDLGCQGGFCRDDGCTLDLWLHVETECISSGLWASFDWSESEVMPTTAVTQLHLPPYRPSLMSWWWLTMMISHCLVFLQVTVSHSVLLIRLSVVLWVLHGIASFLYCQSQKCRRSFQVAGPKFWNSLPFGVWVSLAATHSLCHVLYLTEQNCFVSELLCCQWMYPNWVQPGCTSCKMKILV